VKGCVFAPYFCTDEIGAPHFGAIHKVFGASNFSKLLLQVPVHQRYDAVVSVLYEAEARLQDPVYGCVLHIFALQNQVASLNGKLAALYAQLSGCHSVEGVSLDVDIPQNKNGKQSHISSSTSTRNSPYEGHSFPLGDLQSIPLENVAVNNYHHDVRDERSYSFPCMQGDYSMSSFSTLSTAEQTDVSQVTESLSGQKHPNSDHGDLQDLASALVRRSR
jgi:hypothetical protein